MRALLPSVKDRRAHKKTERPNKWTSRRGTACALLTRDTNACRRISAEFRSVERRELNYLVSTFGSLPANLAGSFSKAAGHLPQQK